MQLSVKLNGQLFCRIFGYLFLLLSIFSFAQKLKAEEVLVTSLQAAFISRFIDFTERTDFKQRYLKICIQSSKNSPKGEDFGDMNSYRVPASLEFFSGQDMSDDCSLIVSESNLIAQHGIPGPFKIALNEQRCRPETHIRFLIENSKLRFAVNLKKVKEDGFELSSKLLALAIIEEC